MNDDETPCRGATPSHPHHRASKHRWLSQVRDWLSVSEPSAQAMKDHRKKTFRRGGIKNKDPNAAAKLHCPVGRIPSEVTTSTTGPTPEKALIKSLGARQRGELQPRESLTSSSASSHGSCSPSIKEADPAAPAAPWAQ